MKMIFFFVPPEFEPTQIVKDYACLFVLRFYGQVKPRGHVERGQLT